MEDGVLELGGFLAIHGLYIANVCSSFRKAMPYYVPRWQYAVRQALAASYALLAKSVSHELSQSAEPGPEIHGRREP